MENDVLKVEQRSLLGTNGVKKLRNEHYIPGVLYGHHIDNVNIKVHEKEFEPFFKKHGTGATLNLDLGGEKTFVLFKDVQLDRMKNQTTHVEFQALSMGEKIRIQIPIHFVGKDKIPAGFIPQELHHEVDAQVLPKDLIEYITLDVSKVQLGEHLKISDLDIWNNEAFEIFDDPDTFVFSVTEPNAQEVDTEEEEVLMEVPEIGKEDEVE